MKPDCFWEIRNYTAPGWLSILHWEYGSGTTEERRKCFGGFRLNLPFSEQCLILVYTPQKVKRLDD